MPCCGQKSDNLRSNASPHISNRRALEGWPNPQPRTISGGQFRRPAPSGLHTVALQYTEGSHIVVEGPATHRYYEFSAEHPVQWVDSRDASVLLGTRFFILK